MATSRIRTLNFLPEIFKTTTNTQFLKATLDQIVDQPNLEKIEGYIGSKFGYGINAKNNYVTEPTKVRTDYQLDPGVVFLKKDTETAQDFISYPGIIDALSLEGGLTGNNDRLFTEQFYSWDSFTDLDKIINFNQYYWLPDGPPQVTVASDIVFNITDYIVTGEVNGYSVYANGQTPGSTNPTITLLRGGTYNFSVNQSSQFWIQGQPGVTGFDPNQLNVQTRDILGVDNNGASVGIVTFTVPSKDAQNDYNFPGNNIASVVSTLPYDQVNGALVSTLGGIDGITSLNGLTLMFYNTGVVGEQGFISTFYDTTTYDQIDPVLVDGFGNYDGGYYTDVSATFYTITYVGDVSNPVIRLVESTPIPTAEKITAQFGTEWIARTFYRNSTGTVTLIPYSSAILDTLYYQDGTSGNKVGQIRLIDSNVTNTTNILTDIIGKKTYSSTNGVVFTNGLKVVFSGDIYPESYKNIQYYVQGVGTAIELIPVTDLIAPELFSSGAYIPYDTTAYDIGNYDSSLYVPITPDYITIARNAIDKNAWSRSNRWFHSSVINATAEYNSTPDIVNVLATEYNKAKRPIIEFYPNLRMFDSGVIGKQPIDFIDFRTTDAFLEVAGQQNYYPDVTVYTGYNATILPVTAQVSTTILVPASSVTGLFQVGQYITDSTNLLPRNAYISNITGTTILTLTVSWSAVQTFGATSIASLIATDTTNDNYALFDGARVVFAADTNLTVRNKIYTVRLSSISSETSTPLITLTEASDGLVLPDEQTVAFRGYNYKSKDFYLNDSTWITGQQKTTVNQPPLFDIFDSNGISFGNTSYYLGTSFTGTTLLAYGIGSGLDDSILGFPIRYSSVNNVGDISFDVTLNLDTFNYVQGSSPITQRINTGYVYSYSSLIEHTRQIGWQTAVAPSVQYQIFEFDYIASNPSSTFNCDIAMLATSEWPTIQVYVNNVIQERSSFTTSVSTSNTIVTFSVPNKNVDTVIQILLLSDQVSKQAYYAVPTNLNNNPLNENISELNVGDIRGQYQSIFYNSPDTSGPVFGSNNYHDLGNLVPYGNKIIQNSASLVLPGSFLRKQNHNLFDALLFNSREYISFKTLLVDTVNNTEYSVYQSPASMLDTALDSITAAKTDSNSFFWSDMLPSKAPYITNTYSFANSLDSSIFALSRIYDFTSANYYGVLVYLTRTTDNLTQITQLVHGTDYTVSETSPSLTISLDLLPGDQIQINEFNQTYGSYVPNTPTKLGLYPSTIPSVTLDSDYSQPTYFIVGHDGSYNKLYGSYDSTTGKLVDFRDQVLLEFETRIFNNLKVSASIPIQEYEVMPGFFRETGYSYDEVLSIYSTSFLNWVGQNRIDYKKQYYSSTNEFTYNYANSGNKIDNAPIEQGYWRGVYEYFYDTSNPDSAPWEMLGFRNQPTWWTARYGAAPYTSDNLVLWNDLAQGIDWNNGTPVVITQAIRPQLLQVLPVDSAGNLVSPFVSIVGNYTSTTFNKDWKVGDVGPAEFSYRRSSTWPFDLMRILALTKPAEFFNLAVDIDNYKYNAEFNQYLVNDRSHLVISDIQVYGTGIPKTSYLNWIVDFEKQVGIDATQNILDLFANLDVRLVYRLAGFSDKNMLKFYVEKGTPNSKNSSLLIPDESYSVLLYDNQPFNSIVYSGVIIQSTINGYKVYGNSQTSAYFTTLLPIINGNYDTVKVEKLSVQVAKDYSLTQVIIPYGTEFLNVQEVSQFLESYGKYLESQGVVFDLIESGLEVNWRQMVAEYLYWAQVGWEIGSIANMNPAAKLLTINKDSNIVQPLTLRQHNFVLNQNLYPIQSVDLSVVRDGTLFSAQPLNDGDTIGYGTFNLSNFEHGIVFDNITLFNDIIYSLPTGLRQTRIIARGTKSAAWDGTINAQGFILNQDNISDWNKEVKYTTGSIVKYKNKYWIAIKIVQATEIFNELDWKITAYDEIQKGLLPNSSTRSYESTLYYDVNRANLENDADLLSFSLIGYRPRDYMASADLTDITQVNVYKNMIKNKGTLNAASVFKGATLSQGGIDYSIYENWAIKTSDFGGVLNNNFAEFRLSETELTGNPSIVGLTNGIYTEGVQQEVPLYSLFNYGRSITNPNILSEVSSATPSMLFPDAGYVNFNDVKSSTFYYSGLPAAVDASGIVVPLSQLYARDYVWIANYQGTWQVYTPSSLGAVTAAKNNLNGTVTITFVNEHDLAQYQPLAIVNFNANIDGYYIVSSIVNAYTIIIGLTLPPAITSIVGQGIGFMFQSQRVESPSDILNLPLLDSEFIKNKVWVDTNSDGSWAVYRKSINYKFDAEVTKPSSLTFGSAVAYTTNLGYLVGDAVKGEVYRYRYNPLLAVYELSQTITGNTTFGSTISYATDFFVISETSTAVSIYKLFATATNDKLNLVQTIAAPGGVTNWGSATAISGDQIWLYISDIVNNSVYAYRKSTLTGLYEFSSIITVAGLVAGDNFGYAISTDYDGDTIIIGAPDQNFSPSIDNWGYTYVFDRTEQNIEAQYTSLQYVPQLFNLASAPTTISRTATGTVAATDRITVNTDTTGFVVDMPVIFSGTILSGSGLSANIVYYIESVISGTQFRVSTTRGGPVLDLAVSSGSMTVTVQSTPVFISVNGTSLTDNNYAVIGNSLSVLSGLTAGDIITVSTSNFVLAQTLTTQTTPRVGVQFGLSVDTTQYTSEILVGAPFELGTENHEGAVYRFTNGGGKYGIILGTSECIISSPVTILLNGYAVTLPIGTAATSASAINLAHITNVVASSTTDNKLIIQLVDISLATPSNKLSLSVLAATSLSAMGMSIYTQTQVINCPHLQGPTQFGNTLRFNEFTSFVASAPTGTRYVATTFDFTDDELDNDTVFDNNTTKWVDTFANAGAVYMFDYLPVYNESLTNVGKFVYAQSTDDISIDYGSQPYYGTALDFNNSHVVVGTPNFKPAFTNGQVVSYLSNAPDQDWAIYRSSCAVVDTARVQDIQLFSALTNTTLDNLDYIDPLQGKILGAARENIDVVSNIDPAGYNSPAAESTNSIIWGTANVGQLWFNTSNVRFVNYHQNDVVYNSKYWGTLFPGSDVAVYSWISSNVQPGQYTGPGTPYDIASYVIEYTPDATGTLVPVYFFWARNTNIIFTKTGKTLADSIIQSYIVSPISTGISYFAPLLPNVFALYNSYANINANDTVLHVGFATGTNDDVSHELFSLIRANYSDDFLPGLPGTTTLTTPESLYNRMLDSLCGVNETGGVVPNPYLPKSVQYGVMARPRQSFFINRFNALENYLTYANEILAQFPISETKQPSFLFNSSTHYDTTSYWSYVNWWAVGYNDNTKSAAQVAIYADLATLTATPGLIVTVAANSSGNSETYVYTVANTWNRIGLTNGTIQFSSVLWDYVTARLGFGDNFFDTSTYDDYPSEATRSIVRSLNEEIYTNELLIYRNKSLILLFEFIQSETVESQNYLPWLNKTSFIDVAHVIRELKPIEVFQSDNQEFLSGYLNEIKPYHVVIKEFLFKYTGTDVYEGNVSDFDLPAQYDVTTETFLSPELVYSNPSASNQYLPTDPIWQTAPYSAWYQNYGLAITGVNNYNITVLSSYIALNSSAFAVDNAFGFPINGTLLIGTELIGYSMIDRSTSIISGLTRGVNGTVIAAHIPGAQITMDLPAVLLLNGGRNYSEPPKVTAYIDTSIYPAPKREAQLVAVMNLDSILRIDVIDPGQGYAILPEIMIAPSTSLAFTDINVNINLNTIELNIPVLMTGDLVTYTVTGTSLVGGLDNGQYYYVNVLESVPTTIVALYTNYSNAVNDYQRVVLTSVGSDTATNYLNISARASCVSSASPIRENQLTLRFDRTSYNSRVTEWAADNFYGSFYAGDYNNSESVASSSILLESTQPPISSILASAQGAAFEITSKTSNVVLNWSSRTRNVEQTYSSVHPSYSNAIQIQPSIGGSPVSVSKPLGSTIGFYIGMPIKFTGQVIGGLINDTTYYVKSLIDIATLPIGFTVSATISNGVPGAVVPLTSALVTPAGLLCYVGDVIDTAIVSIDYPGISTVTATTAATNKITVPLTLSGQGGTLGFYVGHPLFFTGDVFGGVIANETYYVTTIADNQTFTMSTQKNPLMINVTATTSGSNIITCTSTLSLSINDPVIFNDMLISGVSSNTFGGLVSGTVYYVSALLSGNTTFSVSAVINGGNVALTTQAAGADIGCIVTDQKDTTTLTSAVGSMLLNVGLPVSPGQITGQEFTFYPTSSQYAGLSGINGNLVTRKMTSALALGDYFSITSVSGGLSNMYIGMPLEVATSFGPLISATTYTVSSMGIVTTDVTNTSSSGNILTCDSTSGFYVNMPIVFSNSVLGEIELGTTYFVNSVIDSTHFKISATYGGSALIVTTSNGSMIATGEPYIKLSGVDVLTDVFDLIGIVTTQSPTSVPVFDISFILGGYRAIITAVGSGYTIDNTITILGTSLGGLSPKNDLTLTVNLIDGVLTNPLTSTGQVLSVICSGVPLEITNKYYLKVISSTECEVYLNALLTIPVPGADFIYNGIRSTEVTNSSMSANTLTIADSTAFAVNDTVVFTGSVTGGLNVGQSYYVTNITTTSAPAATITVSATVAGSTVDITVDNMTFFMAKSGDYALLPEPFYFDQSVVKFNNRVYQCLISNNDPEFIFGKWELLDSGSRRLNALDRIIGYYQPTVNMPGLDLTQLVDGISYPNGTYLGNAFAPADEFTLDTVLTDQPFYPVAINTVAIAWDGTDYIAASNTPSYSAVIVGQTGVDWIIDKISNQSLEVTDIVFSGSRYVITTLNRATPILVSSDGITWTTNGQYTPYGSTSFDTTSFDTTSLSIASIMLNSVAYLNGIYVAVGENIVTSSDTYAWNETYTFYNNGLPNMLYGVSSVSIPSFTGFVAVGRGQQFTYPVGGITTIVDISLTLLSIDGINWTSITSPLTSYALNSVTNSSTKIVTVGDSGVIFSSTNGSNWVAGTISSTNNLRDVIFANNMFVAVGDNGTIQTSVNAAVWTIRTSTTVENLNGIVWNSVSSTFVVVGDNNTILTSSDGITWVVESVFSTDPVIYDVQGDPFDSGYGPEELVPGVVNDNLTMIVVTRPGTNWSAVEYQHVGYNVVSVELVPTSGTQLVYSFQNVVHNPAQITVAIIDGITKLSTTLYSTQYTINWVNKTIILSTALKFSPVTDILRVDVYEVGNGDQLVKSNSQSDPIRLDTVTGFNHIALDCNYSAPRYTGSGVIRPGTVPYDVVATSTNSINDTIQCDSVEHFILNDSITFQGVVFGNIVEDDVYYVKTISTITNRITVSSVLLSGVAGPTFALSTDSGSMTVIIDTGAGTVWADPIVNHNGVKLVHGVISTVTATDQTNNAIHCNSTSGIYINNPVVFSDTMFGTTIVPQTVYYVKTIVSSDEFTISATLGGPVIPLDTATGGAQLITNDYAFDINDNGITANLVFSKKYIQNVDYLSYSVFGETYPDQYGYTVPETQLITGANSVGPYSLINYVSGDNPLNAIVEKNGIRLTSSAYTINSILDTITFGSSILVTDTVSVTSYNLTERQYLNTQYGITSKTVANIVNIDNVISPPSAITNVSASSSTGNLITCVSTANFIIGMAIIFKGTQMIGSNILTDGTVYFIDTIAGLTTFTISATPAGPVFNPGNGTGLNVAYIDGSPAVRITTGINHNFVTNNTVMIDGTTGSVQLNNGVFYVHVISSKMFDLYTSPYLPAYAATNSPVLNISSGAGGYAWLDKTFTLITATATATTSSGNLISATTISGLVYGTPIIFTGTVFGGIVAGTTYYVRDVNLSTFTVSLTQYGAEAILLSGSGSMNVTQWEQDNVDRLWVTINGYRIPSSSLRLNPDNNVSILTTILSTDTVIITSMVPSETPNQLVYVQNVNKSGVSSVYRANTQTRTWITQPLFNTASIIYLNDITRVTNTITQTSVAPAPDVSGVISIGISADKRLISQIIVYDVTTSTTINTNSYSVVVQDLSPILKITSGVTAGNTLLITIVEGNLIYINGEQIRFSIADLANNTISGLSRGVNGTGTPTYTPEYSEVFSVLSQNKLSDIEYYLTWNSYDFNPVLGDPLQISNTAAAVFLNTDIT